jgi:hypothetical protein
MGYKSGTLREGIVPSKVLASWATDAPQQLALSHGQAIRALNELKSFRTCPTGPFRNNLLEGLFMSARNWENARTD